MQEENKNIVIFMYKYSVIVKGIERHLTKCGYNVTVCAGKVDELKTLAQSEPLFIVYLPNGITEDTAHLQSGWNVILIGEKLDRPGLMQTNPHWEGFAWLDRPLKMDVLEGTVENAIKSGGKKENPNCGR